MSQDASSFERLSQAVDAAGSDAELVSTLQAQEGGVDRVLDEVFAGMAAAFNPQKAAGQEANAQYEIAVPDGSRPYAMRVSNGTCTVERGTVENPRVTLRIGLADFLKLVTNKANGMQLFMTGKLKVSGDLFFAQTMQTWFDRPNA